MSDPARPQDISLARCALAVLRRDLDLVAGGGGGAVLACAFMLSVVTLVPLSIGADRALLARVGVPLIAIAVSLAMLLSLERLFQADLDEGVLDQLALGPLPLSALAGIKALALWIGIGWPLSALGIISAILMGTDPLVALVIGAHMLVGTLAFAGLGIIGAGLAAGVRRAGLLIAILVLPLFAPVVVFLAAAGLGAIGQAAGPVVFFGEAFGYLGALALAALCAGPLATGAALRLDLS